MKAFVRSACELIQKNEPFTLATVVKSTGSTPRSSGAKMLVRADGSISGTIGGGLAEAMACREGAELLSQEDGTARLRFVDMTQELAAESDMICGGGLTYMLEVVKPNGPCAQAYQTLDACMRAGTKAVLHTQFSQGENGMATGHTVERDRFLALPEFSETDGKTTLAEPFNPPASLYIYGAGHVSLFTARVGAMIGLRTVVLDDRADFANTERFPDVDEVRVLDSFDDCCAGLPMGEDAMIVIVTRGHLHDRYVLAEALKTDAGYVGMIGSSKKRDKIYDALRSDGFTQTDIDRCHCPIGLPIGANTPEEIGVAIGAELIQARSRLHT